MKRTAFIHIRDSSETLHKIRSLFEDRVDEMTFQPSGLQIKTDKDRSGYQDLISLINMENLSHTFAEYREYTKKEMKDAEYFHLEVRFPWELDPMKNAEYYGTKYENSDARKCECNKNQVSKLQLDVKKLGKWNIAQIIPEYIITECTKELLESHKLSGCNVHSASDYKERELQRVYQLVITNILPRMHDGVQFEPFNRNPLNHCDSCISKVFIRSEMMYHKEEIEKFKDFNLTCEYINAYEIRQLIVSAKVREMLLKHKIKVVRWEPVRFI